MLNIDEVLTYLTTQCKPSRPTPNKGPWQRNLERSSNWMLAFSGVAFAALVILALIHKFHPLSEGLRTSAAWLGVACMFLALLSLMVGMIANLISWRSHVKGRRAKHERDPIRNEVETDEMYARHLMKYSEESLKYARHCLQTKISRIDGRIAIFFGKELAVLALLGGGISQIKDLGGISWLSDTFKLGLVPGNYLNSIALAVLALVTGLALGAISLKNLQRHYAYQVEIIELALLLKSLTPLKPVNDDNRQQLASV